MCANYLPLSSVDRLLTYFGIDFPGKAATEEVFSLGESPFIRLSVEGEEGGRPALVAENGMFGLLPQFATELRYGRNTYNARSETVHSKPSFRDAWWRSQRCIIPCDAVFEPHYGSGQSVRWRIWQEGGAPLAVAGLYNHWQAPSGEWRFTFTMLTVNCDSHPFYRQFHKPEDEKRMPVFLDPHEYGDWLTGSLATARRFCRMWNGPFVGEPAPLIRPLKVLQAGAGEPPLPRAKRKSIEPAAPDESDLFFGQESSPPSEPPVVSDAPVAPPPTARKLAKKDARQSPKPPDQGDLFG